MIRILAGIGLVLFVIVSKLELTNEKVIPEENSTKDGVSGSLAKIFQYLDENESRFIETLREAVEIQSVSASAARRQDLFRMANWVDERLKSLGFQTEVRQQERTQQLEGTTVQLPPIVLATLGDDPKKKTVLLYGHLDVQPAKVSDGWDFEPFTLTEKDGKLYGRGSTDDKAPVLGWLHAIEAYLKTNTEIPVNIKFVLECMEESGSEGLEEIMTSVKDTFLKNVDAVTISDNYWIGTDKPCLTYGLRGISYFFLEVEGGTKDLHSGLHGGAVHEALPDLIWLLDRLVDVNGKILIPGIMDDVRNVTQEEAKLYEEIELDLNDYKKTVGVNGLIYPSSKQSTLMARWRYPSLTIHGIEGAFSDPGSKTVIPRRVIGKFSLRLVPDQAPGKIEQQVKNYLEKIWSERGSPNQMRIKWGKSGRSWLADFNHPNYVAASQAIELVYGQKPQMTREGGSIPITVTLQEVTGKNVMLLPMGQSDDGAHSQNEKISKRNYMFGTKVFAAYLQNLGETEAAF